MRPSARRPLTSYWADRPLALKGLVVVTLPLVVLLAALVSLFLASHAEERAEDDVRRAFAIQRDTYQVHALLAEAAAGVRGYALTRQERFLEPYHKAEKELEPTLGRLENEIMDPEIHSRFERIKSLAVQKRAGLKAIIALVAANDGTARNASQFDDALVRNKYVLDGMRQEIEQIQLRERSLLDARLGRVEHVQSGFLLLTVISAIVGLLGSLAAVYLFSTGIVRRVRNLEVNAERLAQGEALIDLPDDSDEIGHLARRLSRASVLLRGREEALRESEERFRLVVEEVRDYGIFALDPNGIVASWNLGAERIKGWSSQEILGRHFSTFYPAETQKHLPSEMLERARRSGTAEDEGWRVRKDGSRFWANVVVTVLRGDHGEVYGFAKVIRDMTERRRSEEALMAARKEAIAASLAKSEFLSRTSHELRTPMSAILGFGQLLELDEDSLSPHHKVAVQQIMKAGRHLLSLINDLLDISSIESGGAELSIEAVDVTDVVHDVQTLVAPIVASAGLTFLVRSGEPGLKASADRRRVTQILVNIVANAAKYHRTGSTIVVSFRSDGAHIRIEVEDDGEGIYKAAVPRLFTPFDRLGQSERGKTEGTGLGLALSKRLVESMNGRIGYEAPERGARFWFTLPAAAPSGKSTKHKMRKKKTPEVQA